MKTGKTAFSKASLCWFVARTNAVKCTKCFKHRQNSTNNVIFNCTTPYKTISGKKQFFGGGGRLRSRFEH